MNPESSFETAVPLLRASYLRANPAVIESFQLRVVFALLAPSSFDPMDPNVQESCSKFSFRVAIALQREVHPSSHCFTPFANDREICICYTVDI